MNALPRLVHIISALPLPFDKIYFKGINSLFSSFTWNGKRARISISKLFPGPDKGGLGLPNLEKYYTDINSRYPLKWAYNHNAELTSWEDIEIRIMSTNESNISLKSMWFNTKQLEDIKSPVISFSCEIANFYITH